MTNKSKVEEKKIQEKLSELKKNIDQTFVEELLANNEKEFEYKGVAYRIRRPTFKERQEAYQKRNEKFVELLKNDKYLLEEDLKKLYKQRGVDIDELDKKISLLQKQRNDLNLKLGKALEEKKSEPELKIYRDEIEKINEQIELLSIKKTNLLEYSIERQTFIFLYTYLTYLITEKKENDTWVKAWNSFEEFQNCSEDLVNLVSFYAAAMFQQDFVEA